MPRMQGWACAGLAACLTRTEARTAQGPQGSSLLQVELNTIASSFPWALRVQGHRPPQVRIWQVWKVDTQGPDSSAGVCRFKASAMSFRFLLYLIV